MSKPKIYSFCQAGCKWETVHRDEIAKLAPFVLETTTNEPYSLEMGKLYRIENTNKFNDWNFYIEVIVYGNDTTIDPPVMSPVVHRVELPTFSKNDPYVDFKLIEFILSNENRVVVAKYKLNNDIYQVNVAEEDVNHFIPEDCVHVCSVEEQSFKVYQTNEGAEWVLAPHKLFVKYADDLNGTNMTSEYNYQSYVGMYTGEKESLDPTDYTWTRFVGEHAVEEWTFELDDGTQVVKKVCVVNE